MFKIIKIFYFVVSYAIFSHADAFHDTETAIYSAQCKSGDSKGCVWAGMSYRYGDFSDMKGFEKNRKLCEEGLTVLCNTSSNEKRDNFKAFDFFKEACDKNNALGCYYVGLSYFYGEGIRKDLKESFKFYNKSCENNNPNSCNALGELYQNGKGTKQDLKQALEFFGKACDFRLEEGCKNFARLNN